MGGGVGAESLASAAVLRPWSWVIKLSDVELVADKPLGEGSFGKVFAGTFQGTKVRRRHRHRQRPRRPGPGLPAPPTRLALVGMRQRLSSAAALEYGNIQCCARPTGDR